LKEDEVVENIFSGKLEQPGVKILGISWNCVTDRMYFDFSTLINAGCVGKILDKLILLSILHSLYDPLGVLIPFTIIGKLAMQLCWKLGLSWKAKLPQEVLNIWQPWAIQIQQLNGYSFERTLIPGENPERENQQIHVFADASQDTYAAVAYMISENRGKVSVRFIQARSRIKAVKATHTIPRMELLSIKLGLSMLGKLRTTFDISAHNVFIWTDSRACHDWIRIEARSLQIFVKNRVLKICQYLKLDQVRWLPGAINPADAATRGITVAELRAHKNWLQGPDFL
jgi:ribonuclease HI